MRIGQGYDIHKLVENRPLILGGVEIPSPKGCLAHSDGDVLIHALIDALIGSMALGDIGQFFPDTDQKYKDIDSTILLKTVLDKLPEIKIINIDSTIVLQSPKLAPHIQKIRESLSTLLNLDVSQVSVKAKTAEHMLLELGSSDAIAASVTLLIQ